MLVDGPSVAFFLLGLSGEGTRTSLAVHRFLGSNSSIQRTCSTCAVSQRAKLTYTCQLSHQRARGNIWDSLQIFCHAEQQTEHCRIHIINVRFEPHESDAHQIVEVLVPA